MKRAAPEPWTGTVTPGNVGWTRIIVTLALGVAVAVLAVAQFGGDGVAIGVIAIVAMSAYAFAIWMRLHITFVVDADGLTPKLGGLWKRQTWPASEFRTVQLRHIPGDRVGVTVGNIGIRDGVVAASVVEDVTAVGGLKPRTLVDDQVPATSIVTHGGSIVEIVRHNNRVYLISPTQPRECAEAIADVIKYRR